MLPLEAFLLVRCVEEDICKIEGRITLQRHHLQRHRIDQHNRRGAQIVKAVGASGTTALARDGTDRATAQNSRRT
jgi:hypothetical protein